MSTITPEGLPRAPRPGDTGARDEGASSVRALGHWLDWLLIPIFVLFFTTRLVPQSLWDRSIYQSVAERLIAGGRLYVDVVDNKDPLFYYAIAAQRLIGPFAEYAFELISVLGSALIAAAFARKFYPERRAGQRLVLIGVAFMLTGPHYDLGGSIPPGIFLALLTIWLATQRRGIAAGMALAVLLFTKLIFAPIALAFVVVHEVTRSLTSGGAVRFLARIGAACAGTSAAVLLLLSARGELSGYLAVQHSNLFYSANNVFSATTLGGNVRNHVLTAIYFGKTILLASLAAFLFLMVRFRQRAPGDPLRPYLAACLALYPITLAVIWLTVIWGPHMAVLHIFLALAAAVAVPDLLGSGRPLLAWPAILAWGWALGWSPPDDWFANDPRDFPDRLADLTAPSPEAVALHQVAGPAPVRYARLGLDNDFHHAAGTRRDRLVCPQFFQYRFTEARLLDSILICSSRADYLIVDFPEDEPLVPGTFVSPVANFDELNARWRGFTAKAEAMVQKDFHCVRSRETIRICRRNGFLPAAVRRPSGRAGA